jgi:hypothetical protein
MNFKKYKVAELKLIAKSWNHHIKIDYEKMKKAELVSALEKHLEHDEKGEVVLKRKNDFRLAIVDSDVVKFIKEHKDSSLRYHIASLYKHLRQKQSQLKAEVETGRMVEKIFNKLKKKSSEEKAEIMGEEIQKFISKS